MLAVSWLELLKTVEFTVTPPGFVVPVTNHWAFAPFLKPLPLTVTFRLTVPCAAELGFAEITVICAAVWGQTIEERSTIRNNEKRTAVVCFTYSLPLRTCANVLLHG